MEVLGHRLVFSTAYALYYLALKWGELRQTRTGSDPDCYPGESYQSPTYVLFKCIPLLFCRSHYGKRTPSMEKHSVCCPCTHNSHFFNNRMFFLAATSLSGSYFPSLPHPTAHEKWLNQRASTFGFTTLAWCRHRDWTYNYWEMRVTQQDLFF